MGEKIGRWRASDALIGRAAVAAAIQTETAARFAAGIIQILSE